MKSLEHKTPTLWVALAWTVVTIPMGWGVYQSLVKSLPLFGVASTPTSHHPVGKQRPVTRLEPRVFVGQAFRPDRGSVRPESLTYKDLSPGSHRRWF